METCGEKNILFIISIEKAALLSFVFEHVLKEDEPTNIYLNSNG